jgi:hypothetical protein
MAFKDILKMKQAAKEAEAAVAENPSEEELLEILEEALEEALPKAVAVAGVKPVKPRITDRERDRLNMHSKK